VSKVSADNANYQCGVTIAEADEAVAAMRAAASALASQKAQTPVAIAPLDTVVTSRHGGNIGSTPFYLYPWQCEPEYDQGHSVIVWYDDLVLKQEDLAKAEASLRAQDEAIATLRAERDDWRTIYDELVRGLGFDPDEGDRNGPVDALNRLKADAAREARTGETGWICQKCGAIYDYSDRRCINTAVVDGKLTSCGGQVVAREARTAGQKDGER
jgi:hypothetical protein